MIDLDGPRAEAHREWERIHAPKRTPWMKRVSSSLAWSEIKRRIWESDKNEVPGSTNDGLAENRMTNDALSSTSSRYHSRVSRVKSAKSGGSRKELTSRNTSSSSSKYYSCASEFPSSAHQSSSGP